LVVSDMASPAAARRLISASERSFFSMAFLNESGAIGRLIGLFCRQVSRFELYGLERLEL
jgi:hypothetical protein